MAWRALCLLQFFCLLIIYTYLGLTPHPENSIPVFNDLLMHLCGYIVAAISISLAFPSWHTWQRGIFLLSFSVAIEIGQHFNPPRTFSFMDIAANGSGILLGLAIVFALLKGLPRLQKLL